MRSSASFKSSLAWVLAWLLALALSACGGGGNAGNAILNEGGGSGTTPVLTLTVQLVDANNVATNAVVSGQPVSARAVLKSNGTAVANEVVQFQLDQSVALAKLDPVSGSKLTDSDGSASVVVSSLGASSGAGRVTATATVKGTPVSGSANFYASGSVGTQPTTLKLGAVEIGSASVSAYGTTSVQVRVLQDGAPYTAPVTVSFVSSCAAGKAAVTPSAITQPNGYAVATFVDNGCAQIADNTVTLTATIGTDTKSATMTVRAPTTGSLRMISVAPSDKSITLRGQGGNGRQENAMVTFQLVDVAGNGVGDKDVCFDVTTYIGGLNLDGFSPSRLPTPQGNTTLCGSDNLSILRYVKRTNSDGTVAVQINSGTVPTPVRVRARALYPDGVTVPLETYSDMLSVSTGLPIQRSLSLSVDKANIDGGNFDGEVAKFTVRLADQFSNPVPDGTVVNFIASGGAVCTSANGSCKTQNGACSCDFVSQARRPNDNRVVVTAYAVGLEDFDDANGDNLYTPGEPFSDLGDAFVDANKDGAPSSQTINADTDILIPYQQNTTFRASGDGVRGTAHIRASSVVYLSMASSAGDPTAVVGMGSLRREFDLFTASAIGSYFLPLRPGCPEGTPVPQAILGLALEDGFGNPMAAGTTLVASNVSSNIAPGAFTPNTVLAFGARPPSPLVDLPNLPKPNPWSSSNSATGVVATSHNVVVRGVTDKCSGDASFSLSVTSPRGGATLTRLLLDNGELRSTSRVGFDVRYRNLGPNFSVNLTGLPKEVTISDGATFVGLSAATEIVIDWGDGARTTASVPLIDSSQRSHTYTEAKTYSVRVTAGGNTSVTSVTVP